MPIDFGEEMPIITSFKLQLFQLATVLLLSPLLKGYTNKLKAWLQRRQGPPLLQPYRDLYKYFRKEELLPPRSSWVFRTAPYVYFAAPLVVTLLIPVLSSFPLFWAFAGDMLGGGMVLSLGGFFLVVSALDPGSPYSGIGSSRSRLVSFLAEPVLITVFFTVALVAHATIPYIVQQSLSSGGLYLVPSHLLIASAFFMVVLAETGRIPVDNPDSLHELSMIDESRLYEYTGPRLAILRWGGEMKSFVLLTIFVNVLVTPWGLAGSPRPWLLLAAVPVVFFKLLLAATVVVLVETSGAKLRLFRIPEFLGGAFLLALLGYLAYAYGV